MKITTNGVPRLVIDGYQLTATERAQLDYIDWDAYDRGEAISAEFFRYRGELYDIHEFERSTIDGWDGMQSDSYFSATLFRYVRDGDDIDSDRVIVGSYYSG